MLNSIGYSQPKKHLSVLIQTPNSVKYLTLSRQLMSRQDTHISSQLKN
jgi:predicted transcriptional regulator